MTAPNPTPEQRWVVLYGDGSKELVTSRAELEQAIDAKGPEPDDDPWLIRVYPEGDRYPSMTIGVGEPRVPVFYEFSDEDKGESVSERPEDADNDDEHEYSWGSDYAWALGKTLVPAETARAALTDWLNTGERPATITWEQL